MAKGGGGRSITYFLLAIPIVLMSMATWVLLFFAMAPTMVALVVDRSRTRIAWVSVAGLNAAGVAPYVTKLWFGRHNMEEVGNILMDPYALLIMYGCAALGWGMAMGIPAITGAFLGLTAERRIGGLQAQMKKLVSEWGDEVAGKDKGDATKSKRRAQTE